MFVKLSVKSSFGVCVKYSFIAKAWHKEAAYPSRVPHITIRVFSDFLQFTSKVLKYGSQSSFLKKKKKKSYKNI